MPLDLTKPVTTDNYSTGVLPTIRGNDLALAKFLEGETVTGAQTGIKRYNAVNYVFEYWNGSAWVQMPLNVSGNAATATTLQTARTITIGNTGKSFNGSADVSWSLYEILGLGAVPETAKELGSGVDLNTIQTPGFYSQPLNAQAASGTNYPVPSAGALMVLRGAGVNQIYCTYGSGARLFFRSSYPQWSPWQEIYHSSNLSAASETASGIVELATAAEAQAGTDATRAVTPNGLAAYAGALSFRNKLINAAFTVNQRGYVSGAATTAANQYTLDRWRVVTSGQALSWSGTAPNITITAPAGGVEQVIEGIWIEGGTYTLSWTGTATATVNGSAVANGGTVTLSAGANATVRFSGGTVSKPQLEPGSYATQFEHRPYGLELMLCQRYYWEARSDTYLQGYAAAAGAATYQKVFFPTIMRAVPTVTASFGAAANATGSILGTTSDGFTIRAASAASGAYAIMFYSSSNANAEL